jgi:hypothetical protein
MDANTSNRIRMARDSVARAGLSRQGGNPNRRKEEPAGIDIPGDWMTFIAARRERPSVYGAMMDYEGKVD